MDVPSEFPVVEYDFFFDDARRVVPNQSTSDLWGEFARAASVSGWRYIAFEAAKRTYVSSWSEHGEGGDHQAIYEREHSFFEMFVCALSSLETACYACYILGAVGPPAAFVLPSSKTMVTPKLLARELEKVLPTHQLTTAVRALVGEAQLQSIKRLRNAMIHRTFIPWTNYATVAIGSTPPTRRKRRVFEYNATWGHNGLARDADYGDELARWVTGHLRNLFIGGTALSKLLPRLRG